jgi:predicted transposase YbfD/YdcC
MNSTTNTPEKRPHSTISLYQAFGQVPDPGGKRGLRYPLAVILTVVTLAKLCGETELRGIAQWAQYRAASLCAAFELKREAMPHWTTYSRVLSQVEEVVLQQALQSRRDEAEIQDAQLIIDGKTLRGTIPVGKTQGEHLLSVYAPDSRVVLSQTTVEDKENEIVVAPHLLEQTALKGKVITGDAMFTQRQLSQQIRDAEGDYIWVVKENQPHLYQMIDRLFTPERRRPGHGRLQTDFQTIRQVSKGHGRCECRTLTTSRLLEDYGEWPEMRQVFRLERQRHLKGRPATTEVVYGVTSLEAQIGSPAALLRFVRRHWAIENQLHYVRDVSLREDRCRLISSSAQIVMAILNNLVMALLPQTSFRYLPDAQRFYNAHLASALHLLL